MIVSKIHLNEWPLLLEVSVYFLAFWEITGTQRGKRLRKTFSVFSYHGFWGLSQGNMYDT